MFFAKLKEICKKKETSPTAVCVSLGMSKSNVTKWKKGAMPSLATAVKLADKLEVGVEEFLE